MLTTFQAPIGVGSKIGLLDLLHQKIDLDSLYL